MHKLKPMLGLLEVVGLVCGFFVLIWWFGFGFFLFIWGRVSLEVWERNGVKISQIFCRTSLVSRQNNAIYCIGLADLIRINALKNPNPASTSNYL